MRLDNFSAGPSVLPVPVLERAAREMVCHHEDGMSVMEMSHRSKAFERIFERTHQALARLISLPDTHQILFLQGGASTQFAMVPLNLLDPQNKADYVDTGSWASAAIAEAQRYGDIQVVASSAPEYRVIPPLTGEWYRPDAAYVHLTSNNTIYGTAFTTFPDTGTVPLVADMSSDILSRPVDVSRFGLIYAGAQKNAGPAGLTLVIIRKDLLGKAKTFTPTMLDYQIHAKANSLYNTPPTYAIYIAGLVYEWLDELGGLEAMADLNRRKADMLYHYLDHSRLFRPRVLPPHRSLMNIPFFCPTPELDQQFIAESQARGLDNLKGYRTMGGMRASLYNALPIEAVERLVTFMGEFEAQHGPMHD